nr:response regulator transcription factor [Shewanella litorisediminis]
MVEDDNGFRELLTEALSREGLSVSVAADGFEALALMEHDTPELILLDLMMPGMDGFSMLMKRKNQLPVIVISALDSEEERIRGYQLGADDFLTKPFSVKELMVRMQALARRINRQAPPVSNETAPEIQFDDTRYMIGVGDRQVMLTQTEFKLFRYLFERKGQVVTKAELQRSVLHKEFGRFDRNLDMHISNTRRKLAQTKLPRSMINTVRGQGYSFTSC